MKFGRKYFIKLENGKNISKVIKYTDSIDRLCYLMYDSLAEKKGLFKVNEHSILIKDDSIDYTSVIRAIKFVKNLQHHEIVDVPTDYRTDVKAFGNLFTLFNAYFSIQCLYRNVRGLV